MDKNKLQHLFDCLNENEKKRLPGWLENELYGRSSEIWLWFEQVWKGKTDHQAWEELYPDQVFEQKKINNWVTLLIKWIEEYLAFCVFREDTFARIHYLNRAVIRRNPQYVYPSTIRKSRKYLSKQPVRDKTFYQIQHELDRFDLEFKNSYPGIQIRRYSPDPKQIRENEEMAILLANMEITIRRLNENEALTEWDQYCVSQLTSYLEKNSPEQWPVAYLYSRLYTFLQPQTIIKREDAKEAVKFYQDHFSTLRPDAQSIVGVLLQNGLIRSFFRHEDLPLVDMIFEINIWVLNHSQLPSSRYFYRNLIQIPIFLSQKTNEAARKNHLLQLAHTYLEELKDKLPIAQREEAYIYNLAELQFAEGNFSSLTKQIYALKFKDYAYEINYLILWNKAQYELGEIEGLADRLKNIQHSLQQSLKLNQDLKKRLINQIKYFRKLVVNYRPSILKRLRTQLENESMINGRGWLMTKMDEKIRLQER